MNGAYRTLFVALLFVVCRAPLSAQDTVAVGVRTALPPGQELPDRVADQLVAFYNQPSTIRFSGRTRIPEGRTIGGDVAILSGPVELAGVVNGDLVVLNGDITLIAGSVIRGDLTVVGGIVIGADEGRVDGVVTTYGAVFRYRRTEEGIEYLGSDVPQRSDPGTTRIALPSWRMGSSEIFISTSAYNRVEALPISIGPRITTGGRNPFRIDALLVYRTIGGFEPTSADIGYQVRVTQHLFGHRAVWLNAGIQEVVAPIEKWKLTNLENSLALFFFRRDYRDYYQRKGWYAGLGWRYGGLFGSVEYRDETQRTRETNNVWTIFFNKNDELRPNAAIDEGDLQSVIVTLGVDTRNDRRQPWSGWYNSLSVEQAVDGSLSNQKPKFTALFLDLRRYLRVSYNSVVALRLAGGGRLGSNLLPAQRQHMIGGTGSLPGYDMMQFDCGARGSQDFGTVPGYGCQRFSLFQAEYRTSLDFHWHWDKDQVQDYVDRDIFSIDFNPAVVLFYNAGAAWSTDDDYWDFLTKANNWKSDLGAGLDFGGLGFYGAYPLVGSGGFKFILRLTARF